MCEKQPPGSQGWETDRPHVGRLIHILSHQMKRHSFMTSGDVGDLTATQKHVLQHILMESMHHEVYQRNIEEFFQVRRSSATELLKLLEKKGFITRESVEWDARQKRIIPTEKALQVRAEILKDIECMEDCLREGISDAEFENCLATLKKMIGNISKKEQT